MVVVGDLEEAVVGSVQTTCPPWVSPSPTSSPCPGRKARFILYVVSRVQYILVLSYETAFRASASTK